MNIYVNTISVTETPGCLNSGISPNSRYVLIGIYNEYYRVVNKRLEPILYPKYLFVEQEMTPPSFWVKTEYDDGEYFIEPREFSEVGFYEDYFDKIDYAVERYDSYLKKMGLS